MSGSPEKERTRFEGDSRDLARKLTVVAALRILLLTASLAASVASSFSRAADMTTWHYTLVAVGYFVSLVYVLLLRANVAVDGLAYAQVVIDATLVSALVGITGGTESLFSFAYVFVVLGGAATLYRAGSVLATSACLLLFATVVIVHFDFGRADLDPVAVSRSVLSFFLLTLGLTLTAVLAAKLTEAARTTGRRLAQKEVALEQLEELHAAILRSLPAGLMTLDGDGTIEYANDAALAILNYREAEVVRHHLNEIVPAVAAPWRKLRELRLVPDSTLRFEGSFSRSDGTTRRLGFSFAPMSARPSKRGELIVVFQDVTDIVHLKESVERAERLALVGKMSAGLAHEVRNPLASMCASIEVLKQSLEPPPALQRLMENVVHEGDRLNALITDFLNFAKPQELRASRTDMGGLIQSFAELFQHDKSHPAVSIEVEVEPDLALELDADLVRQLLWNLAKNSAQAMGDDGGSIRVRARAVPGGAELALEDEGPGIPEPVLKRIFDPFYTTREKGTGLGLAIAHSIVEAHQGKIWVRSNPEEGTVFTIFLPQGIGRGPDFLEEADPSLDLTPSQLEVFGPY